MNLHKPEMGYLLLGPPPPKVPSYRGIDRNPFEPLILEGEIQETVLNFRNIWELYPPGWRRDAYRIFEENQKEVGGVGGVHLLVNEEAARRVEGIIRPHVAEHEIVECTAAPLDECSWDSLPRKAHMLGWDAAYPGGDYYSAVLNGLLWSGGEPTLTAEFGTFLNENGLFDRPEVIPRYLSLFRDVAPSERDSQFWVYGLRRLSTEAE